MDVTRQADRDWLRLPVLRVGRRRVAGGQRPGVGQSIEVPAGYGAALDGWIRRYFWQIASAVMALLMSVEVWLYGPNALQWDLLLVTSVIVLILGLWLGLDLVSRVSPTLRLLAARGSLQGDPDELGAVIAGRADRLAGRWGLLVAGLICVSYAWVYWVRGVLWSWFPLILLAGVGGYLAGRVIGRMIAVGGLGRVIARDPKWAVQPQVASLDGAAGLAPIGALYLRQASVLFIPAVFLAAWWALIPVLGSLRGYSGWGYWRQPYLALLAVALVLQLIAFVGPMLSFHRQMREYRDVHLVEVDVEVSKRVAEIEPQLAATHDSDERAALRDEMGVLKERYLSAASCPTWPVDHRVRRKFSLHNAILLVPLVGRALGLSGVWADLANVLGQIFGD